MDCTDSLGAVGFTTGAGLSVVESTTVSSSVELFAAFFCFLDFFDDEPAPDDSNDGMGSFHPVRVISASNKIRSKTAIASGIRRSA